MAESQEQQNNSGSSSEIQINIKGPSELKLQISISLDKTVLELKQAIAQKSDVEAERQRLIYSGRVLKDEDKLLTYKIQSSHTIHMVKGQPRTAGSSGPSSSGISATAAQQLPTMQAGQDPLDPLTVLNGPMGHGLMAGFNPFADIGLNPNDPNMMQNILQNPAYLQQMSSLMSNPAIMDQLIQSDPRLRAMGPQVRQALQSEQFRQMLSNPEQLGRMFQMANALRSAGLGGGGGAGDPFGLFGGAGGAANAFPSPGLPSYAQAQNAGTPQAQGQTPAAAPGTGAAPAAGSPGAGAPPPDPFALLNLLGGMQAAGAANPMSPGSATSTGSNTSTTTNPPTSPGTAGNPAGTAQSPFGMVDPALVQSLLGGLGGGAGLGQFGLGGFGGAPPAPADTRAPEERFQVQLQQLQEMGFTNAQQNVRALLATAGNVQAAIEYILGGGGI